MRRELRGLERAVRPPERVDASHHVPETRVTESGHVTVGLGQRNLDLHFRRHRSRGRRNSRRYRLGDMSDVLVEVSRVLAKHVLRLARASPA